MSSIKFLFDLEMIIYWASKSVTGLKYKYESIFSFNEMQTMQSWSLKGIFDHTNDAFTLIIFFCCLLSGSFVLEIV